MPKRPGPWSPLVSRPRCAQLEASLVEGVAIGRLPGARGASTLSRWRFAPPAITSTFSVRGARRLVACGVIAIGTTRMRRSRSRASMMTRGNGSGSSRSCASPWRRSQPQMASSTWSSLAAGFENTESSLEPNLREILAA